MDNPSFRVLVLLSISSLTYGQSVKIFDHIHFSGDSLNIDVSETNCINVPHHWNDRASSIQLETECAELFEHIDCGGRSIKLKIDSSHLDNFVELNFNDQLTSLRGCKESVGDEGLCVAEHNEIRAREGLTPFEFSAQIARASQIHIERVVKEHCDENDGDPHRCPGEKTFWDRFIEQGYNPSTGAENFASGHDNCKAALGSWMNSEFHRANIIDTRRHIGCGRQGVHWCCGFASPV